MYCLFSGEETNSREHVIPAWLQRRLNLYEQTVVIPNGTTLKYKHLKVPASSKHNHKFGKIEHRISQGIFDQTEVYLWAMKLHIGCIYRDSSLRFDIKDPNAPFILNIGNFQNEIWFFQHIYNNWASGGSTDPNPLGSVYITDSLTTSDQFDFIHCLVTGTVAIDIGDKFILVFLWDQGDALHSSILDQWNTYHTPRVGVMRPLPEYADNCYLAHHVWACESAYWIYRHRRSFNMMSASNKIVLVPPMARMPPKEFNEAEYTQVCRNFGLEIAEFKGEIGNIYKPITIEGRT